MEWCAKWRINLSPEKTKLIMFSRTLKETANKPALFLYGIPFLCFPHAKFLSITFDHKFTFKKQFKDILEPSQQKYHRIRMLVNQKWALCLPRYISTKLLHETLGLLYVKDRLSAVATGQLRNSFRNPLVKHTVNTSYEQ